MIGKISIYLFTISSIISIYLYILSAKRDNVLKYARIAFLAATTLVLFASSYLLSNILNDNFQFTYIYQYSSAKLPLYLKISSFFAGQEGSFLLWTLFSVTIGFLLQIGLRDKPKYEKPAMTIYSLILLFLGLILIAKSPFEYYWQTFPDLPVGSFPPDGQGLNPILENFWITIHPPILFLGYALLFVPFTLAAAGFVIKDYSGWIDVAKSWLFSSAAVLGLGIALGAFWAYETLGWGGFWGWDPVENSSLIPWLVLIALIHTVKVQKRTNTLIRFNYILATTSFILVLFATYLTRSGVLGDFSVHSFISPGRTVYMLLLGFILFFAIGSVAIFATRAKHLPSKKEENLYSIASKEFNLLLGATVLLASAFIILLGTVSPILGGIFGFQPFSSNISFYNNWNYFLFILIALTSLISLYTSWKDNQHNIKIINIIIPLILSIILTYIICHISSIKQLYFIVLIFMSLFNILGELYYLIYRNKVKLSRLALFLGHSGLSVMVLGVVFSGANSYEKFIALDGEGDSYFKSYKVSILSKTEIEKDLADREKYKYEIKLENGNSFTVDAIVNWSDFNRKSSPFFEPGIKRFLFGDFYVAPKSVMMSLTSPYIVARKNQQIPLPIDSNAVFELIKFDMSKAENIDNSEKIILGAIAKFDTNSAETDTIRALLDLETGECDPYWRDLRDGDYQIGFYQLIPNRRNMSQSEAVFAFKKRGEPLCEPEEILQIEIVEKPMINLVWLGFAMISLSFIFSYFSKTIKR